MRPNTLRQVIKMDVLKFDPDQLVLSKRDITEMMDSISKRWSKNKSSNYKFIISIEAMKIGIRLMDENTVGLIWKEIINGFNELMYENAMAKARGENESWSKTLERVKTKLKDQA